MLSSLSQKASYYKSVNPIHNAFSNEYYDIRESFKLSPLSKLFSFERNEIKAAIYCFYLNEQLGAKDIAFHCFNEEQQEYKDQLIHHLQSQLLMFKSTFNDLKNTIDKLDRTLEEIETIEAKKEGKQSSFSGDSSY